MKFISPSSFWTPDYIVESAWLEHAPFAFWLMEAHRPRMVVELGTHRGFSYCCFCQAIERLGLNAKAYAIDTWQGDEHAGFYGEDVFQKLSAYHERYKSFSQLIRSTFDEALPCIADNSVDLLHIVGRHSYEDVKHDFESWRPKLSNRGVVLFHDTEERQSGFSVFQLWSEIKARYPSFDFLHGHGLGVIRVGHDSIRPGVEAFFAAAADDVSTGLIRDSYSRLGKSIADCSVQPDTARLNSDLVISKAAHETLAAKLQKVTEDCDYAYKQLERARKRPLSTALRYYKWKTSKYLMSLRPFLGSEFYNRMQRRRKKNAPDYLEPTEARQFPGKKTRSNKKRLRRWRQSRAILAFAPILPSSLVSRMRRRLEKNAPKGCTEQRVNYALWISKFDTIRQTDRALISACIRQMPRRPLISIVMPVYNTPAALLEKAINSVRSQLYDNWELCIADDASTKPHVRSLLTQCAAADPRIKVHYRDKNGHISACSNDALALATGYYIGLLDHDDELHETALFHVALEINDHPNSGIIFSDEDKIDISGNRQDPYFKCGFSYDLFLAQNLISHFGVYKRDLVNAMGGFRVGFEGAQDWDLALRVLEKCGADNVRHIPRVLYHWRILPTSTSTSAEAKPYAKRAGMRAVEEHLERRKLSAEVVENNYCPMFNRVRFRLSQKPLVSIMIPTFNGYELIKTCISSIYQKTIYKNFEIILIDNQSDDEVTIEYMKQLEAGGIVKLVSYPKPFNYSAINNFAAGHAEGEVLVLLNNDTEVISEEWLDELTSHAMRPEVGAVGALLLYPDDTMQHAGVIIGMRGVAGHPLLNLPSHGFGYFGRAQIPHNVSAVTGACLAVRREVFREVGGLDEVNLPVAFNDIDFCLRIAEKGYKITYTPYARLYHYESKTRGRDSTAEKQRRFAGECNYMRKRHAAAIANDPLYNPNLTLSAGNYSLSFEPRVPTVAQLCEERSFEWAAVS